MADARRMFRRTLREFWVIIRAVSNNAGVVILFFLHTIVALVITVFSGWIDLWEWLRGADESGSTTLRNVGLLVGGEIALVVAIWRSRVAELSLQSQRYQASAEMLGSVTPSVRLAGIFALRRLAREAPFGYHVEVVRLLCAFVRDPTTGAHPAGRVRAGSPAPTARQDVAAAIDAIGELHGRYSYLERDDEYTLQLAGADLSHTHIRGSLTHADLRGADLTDAILDVDLSHADLSQANLTSALLGGATITGTVMLHTRGLTPDQINEASADRRDPPRHMRDATDKPLTWRREAPK